MTTITFNEIDNYYEVTFPTSEIPWRFPSLTGALLAAKGNGPISFTGFDADGETVARGMLARLERVDAIVNRPRRRSRNEWKLSGLFER